MVRLRVPGLDASRRVWAHYATGFDELVAFFNGLAADWRGWQGERTYESLEHDLRLTRRTTAMSISWFSSGTLPGGTGGQRPGSCSSILVRR
jgi:Family of unknown function (DUF6228)